MKLTFLGTGGSMTSVERSLNSSMLQINNKNIMIDCGEGTAAQLLKAGLGFHVDEVFLTHLHTDHVAGLMMLLHNMSVKYNGQKLKIFGPKGVKKFVKTIDSLNNLPRFDTITHAPMKVELEAVELKHAQILHHNGFIVEAFKTFHRVPSLGYRFTEVPKRGKFNVELALAHGLKPGPAFNRLANGEEFMWMGETLHGKDFVGPSTPGKQVVFTGDTMVTDELKPWVANADLWVSEGTYTDEFMEQAKNYGHTCVIDAAMMAKATNVKQLCFTHITPRFVNDVTPLLEQSGRVFEGAFIPGDLDILNL